MKVTVHCDAEDDRARHDVQSPRILAHTTSTLAEILQLAVELHVAVWRTGHLPILQGSLLDFARNGVTSCLVVLKERYADSVIDFLHQQGLTRLSRAAGLLHADDERKKVKVCECTVHAPLLLLGLHQILTDSACRCESGVTLSYDETAILVDWKV